MITAEQFKCEIPLPNGLKEGVLYCSTNATNAAEIWTAAAAVVTALATAGLVLGVVIAFRQIKENRQMHEDQQQLDALASYITAMQFFETLRAGDEEELVEAATRVRSTGLLFALVFRIQNPQTIGSIRRFEELLIDFAMLEFQMRDKKTYSKNHYGYNKSLTELAGAATEALPRLRQRNFGIDDLSKLFTQAANDAQSQNPESAIEALVFRGLFGRKNQ
ncbi:hypothetical protein [Glutamicibacter arilaitensis]|uniref:hypothetical protein n=1 Tax=Glutamicibacter arilaitensis TaxID=256701 RepID=UPI00384A49E2